MVGSTTYNLNLTGNNNLTGLMNAINSAGAGVTASYYGQRWSLFSFDDGPTRHSALNDIPSDANLISSTNQGANAQFMMNGVSVTKASNTISDIIPGVSFNLLNTTTPTTPSPSHWRPILLNLATRSRPS